MAATRKGECFCGAVRRESAAVPAAAALRGRVPSVHKLVDCVCFPRTVANMSPF
jgi:hypothetical protein